MSNNLSKVSIFEGLTAQELAKIGQDASWNEYSQNQQIIVHNESDARVCFLCAGKVRVTIYSPSGREVVFRDLSAGETFGEIAAIDGGTRSTYVIALEDSVVASLPADRFRELILSYPSVALNVMQTMAKLVRLLTDRVTDFSTRNVNLRIREELLRLAQANMVDELRAVIKPRPMHTDIANRVSTHREAVTRELSELRRAGIIKTDKGCLTVPDVTRLMDLQK